MGKHRDITFGFLSIGHFYDHFFPLIYATAAALSLTNVWQISYAQLVTYATPGFIAFALGSYPAGWLADRWSREGMMTVFFIGIGISSILAGLAPGPLTLAACLVLIGTFAAIYHPVGLAMVIQGRNKTGIAIATNGVFGNLGVACAALVSGFLISLFNWRVAFILPGILATLTGMAWFAYIKRVPAIYRYHRQPRVSGPHAKPVSRQLVVRALVIILATTAIGGFVFQSTTFTLPKVIAELLANPADSASVIGSLTFAVFAFAAFAQLAVGHLVDKHPVKRVFAVVALAQAIPFAVMTQVSGSTAMIVAVIFMLAVFGQVPINDVLISKIAHSEWRSRIYAIRAVVTFTMQAVTLPFVGWLYGHYGFNAMFISLSAAALLIMAVVLALPSSISEMRRQ